MAIQDINAYAHLTDEDVAEIGRRFAAIEAKHRDSLGEKDASYIRNLVRTQRWMDVGSRIATIAHPALALPAALVLGNAKILENLEIGHNVMHGQWDWMNDPEIHSTTWEWDNAGPSSGWKNTHNVTHHTYTNIIGMDNDVGYGVLRVTRDRKWTPSHLLQPVTNVVLASLFELAVGFYDVELGRTFTGRQTWEETKPKLFETFRKVGEQFNKDYVAFPLVAGAAALVTGAGVSALRKKAGRKGKAVKASKFGRGRKSGKLGRTERAGLKLGAAVGKKLGRALGKKGLDQRRFTNSVSERVGGAALAAKRAGQAALVANFMRNVWAYAVIFCGHFPDDAETFTKRTLANESRDEWYLRQMLGSANFEGGKLLTIMSGNLNYQIEHHLYPDMPSNRLAVIGAEVKEIAKEFGLPYNTDSFPRQLLQVQRTLLKLSLPNHMLKAKPSNAPEVRSDEAFTENPEIAAQVGNRELAKGLALLKAIRPKGLLV